MPSKHTLHLDASSKQDIEKAADLILSGEVVAFPTETVYGLGALGYEATSIKKIYAAKGRPAKNPLIYHVTSPQEALSLWKCPLLSHSQKHFERFAPYWPAPLTLVNFHRGDLPSEACAGLPTVAVRIPQHPIAQQLLHIVEAPLVAPSANASNRPSSTSAEHVLRTLNGKIAAVLDGGSCSKGIESTIIDITLPEPEVLRLGAFPIPSLPLTSSKVIKAPGQLSQHYAPLVEQILLADKEGLLKAWLSASTLLLIEDTFSTLQSLLGNRPSHTHTVVLSSEPSQCSFQLYEAFYQIEKKGTHQLLIENCSERTAQDPLWAAIQDRLLRASC